MIKKYLIVLSCILLQYSCSRSSENNQNKNIDNTTKLTNHKKPAKDSIKISHQKVEIDNINIFFENSLSMYGYVPDPVDQETAFRDNLRKLLIYTQNEYGRDNTTVSLINNKQTHKTNFLSQNIEQLNKNTLALKKYKKGRGNSDFDKLIYKIIEDHQNNDLSILLADFIYSPSNSNIKTSLTKLQDNITDALLTAKKDGKDINIKIYRFLSDFKGNYYDKNNTTITGITKRPYFMFVIGNNQNINNFSKNIEPNLTDNSSFTHAVSLDANTYNIDNYSVLLNTLNQGYLKAKKGINTSKVKALELISQDRNSNGIQVAVAVDFSKIPVNENYLLNKDNYKVNSQNISLAKIGKIEERKVLIDNQELNIKPIDISKTKNCTHLLVFSSTNPTLNDINFSLEKKLPVWIDKLSINNDIDIKSNKDKQLKTLGFNYIANGISKANNEIKNNNQYLTINIPVTMVQSNNLMPTIIWIIGLVLIFLIVFIIIKNKSRN